MKKTVLILSVILLFTSCDAPHRKIGILVAVGLPQYLKYVKTSNASAAEVYLKAIYTQVGFYTGKLGTLPTSLDDMRNENVLDLEQKAEIDWDFDLSGIQLLEDQGSSSNFTGTLVATSTAEMGGGEGKVVQYDIETATFCGYGHGECAQIQYKKITDKYDRKKERPTYQKDCEAQDGIWFYNYDVGGICLSWKEYKSYK